MPDALQTLFDLIGQFTGTGVVGAHPIVPLGIAATFWGTLLLITRTGATEEQSSAERWLRWGFRAGLARELFIIAVAFLEAYGAVAPEHHLILPPFERAITNAAEFIVAAGYIRYLAVGGTDFAARFLKWSLWSALGVYVTTSFSWGVWITNNPTGKFGQTWGDWAFRINAGIWLGLAIVHLWRRTTGWQRRAITTALMGFFLFEFVKIPDVAPGGVYEYIYAPIRHLSYLAALPVLMYILVRQRADQLAIAVVNLEATVGARTAELEEANEQLREVSLTDVLTGLRNRAAFDEALDAEWRRARRTDHGLSVLMLDLDHFKRVNDTYGHPAGDEVLRRVSDVLAHVGGRGGDMVARFGGEEFVVLLPETDTNGATQLAEAMREGVAALTVALPSGDSVQITVSVGVATTMPDAGGSPNALVAAADAALYRAKDEGRNRVTSVSL